MTGWLEKHVATILVGMACALFSAAVISTYSVVTALTTLTIEMSFVKQSVAEIPNLQFVSEQIDDLEDRMAAQERIAMERATFAPRIKELERRVTQLEK